MYLQEFNNLFTKNVRVSFDNGFQMRLINSAYTRFFMVADTDEIVEKFNSTEGMDLPDYVTEDENLPETKLYKGYLSTFVGAGYGHRIKVTKEARLSAKDNTLVLATLINREKIKALDAFNWFIEKEAHKFLNNAFIGGGNYVAPDGQPFISATHQWNSSAAQFSNLLPAAALDQNAVQLLEKAAASFKDAQGNEMPLNMDTCIVKKGSKASYLAKQLFGVNSGQYSPTTLGNVNIFQGGAYTLIETPFISNVQDGSGNNKEDTAYFFADSRFLGMDNALFLHFLQRPRLEGEATQLPNLTYQYYFYGHMKLGIRNLPIGWYGSVGA